MFAYYRKLFVFKKQEHKISSQYTLLSIALKHLRFTKRSNFFNFLVILGSIIKIHGHSSGHGVIQILDDEMGKICIFLCSRLSKQTGLPTKRSDVCFLQGYLRPHVYSFICFCLQYGEGRGEVFVFQRLFLENCCSMLQ